MKLKIIALFMCVAIILVMAAACGEKDENEKSAGDNEKAEETTPAPIDETKTPATTQAPTDPPTTEEPTEPIDPNLPYYEYLDVEFARFGFVGGDRIVAETEQAVMDAITAKGFCSKSPVEVDEDVPFGTIYRFTITDLAAEMWETAAELKFSGSKTLTEGDIIAGCMYVRDAGGPNPAQFYLAIKTPTNDWGSEGDMNVNHFELEPGDGWQKIYFYGEAAVDEDPASTAIFEFFMGYDPHTIEIGGLYIMRYPDTVENMKATMKMP